MNLPAFTGIAYGILLIVGGWVGYAKAHSLTSLKMGTICGITMIAFGLMMAWNCAYSLVLALGTSALLCAFFIFRLILTGKWMPSGLMAAISLTAAFVFLWQYWKR